jgi:hypothetical protein
MEWENLVRAFSLCNGPYSRAYKAQPPTETSIGKINRSLGIVLPQAFIRFSRECPIYGTWFASIGEDFESFMHIVELNRVFHQPEGDEPGDPLPPWLVMINHGHDGDCDCYDTRTRNELTGDYLIQYWKDRKGPSRRSWQTLHEYLEFHVRNWAKEVRGAARQEVDDLVDRS